MNTCERCSRLKFQAGQVKTKEDYEHFFYWDYLQFIAAFDNGRGKVTVESATNKMTVWQGDQLERLIEYVAVLDEIYSSFETVYPLDVWYPKTDSEKIHLTLFAIMKAAVILK